MKISAVVPCYNNAPTLSDAIASVLNQSLPVAELFVLDDSSKDSSVEIAERYGIRIIQSQINLGRGAVRARAIKEATQEYLLSCDATNVLAPDFIERASPWFNAANVAAVFGRICQDDNSTAVLRWRGRHLFKTEDSLAVNRYASLATYGVLLRKSHVLAVGNFNPGLRHSEDADLGKRLLAEGYEVVFDPQLHVIAITGNSLGQVLERYWRWNAGKDERVSWKEYLKQMVYSVKVMARQDWESGDIFAVPISLLSPHYQFWRSWILRSRNRSQNVNSNLSE